MFMPLLMMTFLQSPMPTPPPEPAVEIAPKTFLIRGTPMPGRGPDGNTIIIDAPDGLIVVDTGRHKSHSDAILNFARAHKRPIATIVNTHWHLDHASGNARLKADYPKARVYTTTAVERALAPGGFLARNLADATTTLKSTTDAVRRDEIQIFIDTMAARNDLRPDEPVTRSQQMTLSGYPLDIRVTDNAVTDADVWLFDPATRVAVIGDLVTMPVPYFETACPDRWRVSMDEVWATPFETAVPGHGAPLTRAQFDTYRHAFGSFVNCVRSDSQPAHCAAIWLDGIGALAGGDQKRREAISANAEYYVGYLRRSGGKAPDCLAR